MFLFQFLLLVMYNNIVDNKEKEGNYDDHMYQNDKEEFDKDDSDDDNDDVKTKEERT